MVYGFERVARRWARDYASWPRIGVGDISAEDGGYLSGHASHQKGVDMDASPVRNDGAEARVTIFDSASGRPGSNHASLCAATTGNTPARRRGRDFDCPTR